MYINEIVWIFVSSYNNILWYSKGKIEIKNKLYKPYKSNKTNGTYRYHKEKYGEEAAQKRLKKGQLIRNTWEDIPSFKTIRSKSLYPTEKPFKLLERIILLSTEEE